MANWQKWASQEAPVLTRTLTLLNGAFPASLCVT
jgi:hypothetical protein